MTDRNLDCIAASRAPDVNNLFSPDGVFYGVDPKGGKNPVWNQGMIDLQLFGLGKIVDFRINRASDRGAYS